MGEALSTYGREKSCMKGFWWGSVKYKVEDHLEDTGVDGEIILRWFFSKCDEDMDRMYPAQNREGRRAPLNAVMNLWFA
jgi:hypothetical protein